MQIVKDLAYRAYDFYNQQTGIHVSVRVVPVRGALSHDFSFLIIIIIIIGVIIILLLLLL